MQKISTSLWLDGDAEKAAKFYRSVFKDFKMGKITRYSKGSYGKPGAVLTITINILGQEFMLLNGGPQFKFNESVSFMVNCKTQAEIDYYWKKLASGGGKHSECGWLKDKFGLSWQVTPVVLMQYISGKNPKKVEAVTRSMLKMKKLDIKKLRAAYDSAT